MEPMAADSSVPAGPGSAEKRGCEVESNRKSRMVSFRLEASQYEALKRMYRAHGAHSVSEFARRAIERLIASPPESGAENFPASFEALLRRVEDLQQAVERLSRASPASRATACGG